MLQDFACSVKLKSFFLLLRLFPSANILTELDQATNMRFMSFKAQDQYSMNIAKFEKVLQIHLFDLFFNIFSLSWKHYCININHWYLY